MGRNDQNVHRKSASSPGAKAMAELPAPEGAAHRASAPPPSSQPPPASASGPGSNGGKGSNGGNGDNGSNGGNGGSNGSNGGNGHGWQIGESLIDATAYPLLTEQVQISQPPGGTGAGPGGSGRDGGGTAYGQLVNGALRDVLGWQPRGDDPKGFLGALTQSFGLRDVEGHTEWTWTPRSYAVQTDLSGGITGAQASLLTRAKLAVDASLPLLDGLYPLKVNADPQDSEALRAMVRRQLTELVDELGTLGGPRVTRVDQIFSILLGSSAGATVTAQQLAPPAGGGALGTSPAAVNVRIVLGDPEKVGGTLGTLREEFGFDTARLVNTIDEEQNLTNFRILADYVVGLERSWLENRAFLMRTGGRQPFFGTQLVLLSRQLSVISESVSEIRFALDSVFIGPLERQTVLVIPREITAQRPGARSPEDADFDQPPPSLEQVRLTHRVDTKDDQVELEALDARWWVIVHPELFIEELLSWIESFATTEGPEVIRSGGKLGVQQVVTPTARRLLSLTKGLLTPKNHRHIPDGFFTPRVRRAFHELAGQLFQFVELAKNIHHRAAVAR